MRRVLAALGAGFLMLMLMGIPYSGPRWPALSGAAGGGLGSDAARVRGVSTGQTLSGAGGGTSNVDILWGAESYDVTGWHSIAVNTERFEVPAGEDGLYLVVGTLRAPVQSGLNQLLCEIQYDADGVGAGGYAVLAIGNHVNSSGVPILSEVGLTVAVQAELVAASYIKMQCDWSSGAATNFVIDTTSNISITRLGPTA